MGDLGLVLLFILKYGMFVRGISYGGEGGVVKVNCFGGEVVVIMICWCCLCYGIEVLICFYFFEI